MFPMFQPPRKWFATPRLPLWKGNWYTELITSTRGVSQSARPRSSEKLYGSVPVLVLPLFKSMFFDQVNEVISVRPAEKRRSSFAWRA